MTLGFWAAMAKPLSNGPTLAKASRASAWLAVAVAAGAGLAAPPAALAAAAERQTPSGLPVPRYLTLKFGEVNARAGPGDDYPTLWVYRVRGLPVQVVAETAEWRKVCDPEGGAAWVHRRTTDGHRAVIRMSPTPLALKAKPDPAAPTSAILPARAMAALDRCKNGWCQLKGAGRKGWAPANAVWGVDEKPQCK
jgi:SH3-like domain-containing protein